MESIEKSDDDAALKSIIDLAETCPKFLRPQLDQLFVACMKVYGDADQEDSWRHLALEVLVTLCETAPAMVRKVAGNQLAQAIQGILQVEFQDYVDITCFELIQKTKTKLDFNLCQTIIQIFFYIDDDRC